MNLNKNAAKIARGMIGEKDRLQIAFYELDNGTKVIDCGIKTKGSREAGKLFSEACMGELGRVNFLEEDFNGLSLPCVEVKTDFPSIACLASQKAGWNIKVAGFNALGSGPARILAKKPKETIERVGYEERAKEALIAMETNKLPTTEASDYVANKCNIKPENLYILVTKTSSQVGAIQVSGRVVETALYKLNFLGIDANKIERASGIAPIAPLVESDIEMMGMTNDMIIYGSKVYLYSREDIDITKVPSSISETYGRPFLEIFEDAGRDFYRVNPEIFSPAEVYFSKIGVNKFEKAGKINVDMIKKSLELKS